MSELSTISGSTVDFAFFSAVCCTAAIMFSKRSGGGGASSLAAATQWVEQVKTGGGADGAFVRFQALYIGVFLLMMAGDWLQGPLVFQMTYKHLGSDDAVFRLQVIGYLSGMLFAFVVGGF